MGNYNQCTLLGNLTRDPESRYVSNGSALVKFGMAINETYGDKDGAERKQRTTFVDLVAWGVTGDTIAKYLKKGDPIFVVGRLDYSSWVDAATGKNRNKLEVVVQSFQFVGGSQRAAEKPDTDDKLNQVPF